MLEIFFNAARRRRIVFPRLYSKVWIGSTSMTPTLPYIFLLELFPACKKVANKPRPVGQFVNEFLVCQQLFVQIPDALVPYHIETKTLQAVLFYCLACVFVKKWEVPLSTIALRGKHRV